MLAQLARMARECNPQNVANLMRAHATMGRNPGERVLGALNARAVVSSTGFDAHHIVLTKWAHATIGTELSNELAAALSVREDALYAGGGAPEHRALIGLSCLITVLDTRPVGWRWWLSLWRVQNM